VTRYTQKESSLSTLSTVKIAVSQLKHLDCYSFKYKGSFRKVMRITCYGCYDCNSNFIDLADRLVTPPSPWPIEIYCCVFDDVAAMGIFCALNGVAMCRRTNSGQMKLAPNLSFTCLTPISSNSTLLELQSRRQWQARTSLQ
jgi:hypothetical protein